MSAYVCSRNLNISLLGLTRIKSIKFYIFFHVNNVIGNIAENNIVTFDLERGVKGMNAINISLENKST